ncbi:MAG TPA: BTAD domain-containing putative transcriptional regulator [Meiothermus sp.]|nr:BTAD domain-containing putative transcriptional regulator [Meiothermus sp.]
MSRLELRLLGPPELSLDGQKLALPTRKLLGLLAYLALEGPTPRSKLADLFWSETEEESARGNLRRELNRLRHTPLARGLEAERDLLRLGEVHTDVAGFRACLAAGRLKEALAHYRGELLEGLELSGAAGFEGWLQAERETLAQARYAALAQYAEQLEAAGNLREALAARLELLREDELQELQHREAMRLHALLGEREAALTRFARLKELLRHELHLEPLPETLELAHQIEQGTLAPPPPPPAPTGRGLALDPPLIGREAEWARMEAAWEAGQAIYLCGTEGVGKTRLMQEFARRKGPLFLLQAQPGDSGVPYALYTRAIRQSLAQFPRLELPPWARRELARLLPELEDSPLPPITTPEGKLRLLEAITEVIRALGRQGVRSIVTDDLQFVSDAASNEVAAYALGRLLPEGVLHPLVAFRREELDPLILQSIQQQVLQGQAILIELKPLSETDLLRLVRALSGSSGAIRFTQRLYGATGGNPLFVLETLKALFESGALQVGPEGWRTPYDQETEDYRELPLPASVREAVTRRLQGLGAASRRLLEAASLAGDGFGLEELEGATALSEWESLGALEQALAANLLQQQGSAYAFSHDLVRRSIREGMGAQRRQLLHRKLAQSLERQSGNPARIAEHWEEGGKPQAAIPWRIRAAEAAVRVYAHAEALEQYARALQDGADADQAFAIYRARIEIWADQGNFAEWAQELARMEALSAENPAFAVPAALARVRFANRASRFEEALKRVEAILQDPHLTPVQSGQARYERGIALVQLGRVQAGEEGLQETLAHLPPELAGLRAPIYNTLYACAWRAGNWDLAEERARQAHAAARETANPTNQVQGLANLGKALMQKGDYSGALEQLQAALNLARGFGHIFFQRQILLDLYTVHYHLDDFEAGIAGLEEGLRLARDPQDPLTEGTFLNNLGFAYRQRGQLGRALESIQAAIEIADRIAMPLQQVWRRITLADLWLDLGSPERAGLLLSEARELLTPAKLHALSLWLEAVWARYCWLARGEADPARLEEQLSMGGASSADQARARWVLGSLRLARGDALGALEAVAELERSAAMRPRALALSLRAEVRLGQPTPQSLEQAVALLDAGKLPALERLELEQSLLEARLALGELEEARRLREKARRHLRELAQSLKTSPDLERNFLDLYPDLAHPE